MEKIKLKKLFRFIIILIFTFQHITPSVSMEPEENPDSKNRSRKIFEHIENIDNIIDEINFHIFSNHIIIKHENQDYFIVKDARIDIKLKKNLEKEREKRRNLLLKLSSIQTNQDNDFTEPTQNILIEHIERSKASASTALNSRVQTTLQETHPLKFIPILSEALDQKVLDHLQGFGLSPQKVETIWGDFTKVMPTKGPLLPLCLATNDPHFIAYGLWRVHQEMTNLQTEKHNLLSKPMLFCLLTKKFSNEKKEISPIDAQILTKLVQSNPYFTTFDFFKAEITDNHLSAMGIIPHLQEFSLEENEITDTGIETLMHYPNLRKLNLDKNKITPQGVALLAKSPTLRHLNLYKNKVGDEGAEILSYNTVLTYLDLRATGVGDRGAQALGKNNKTLTDLRLRYNNITDLGAEAFLNSHHLTHLELARNQISDNRVFFLEHLMPSNGYLNKLHDHKLSSSFLPVQKDRVRILSIDGGGIRGILPGGLLKYIEDSLTQKTGSQFHFAQHVDLMAGTSTGGIISLGLIMPGERGRPKYTMQTLLDLYTRNGHEIFPGSWTGLPGISKATYSPENIDKYLNNYFEDVFLSESLCPTLITSFNLKSNESHIFDSLEAKVDKSKNFHIKGVGRATSAAPTYFPYATIKNKLNENFEFADGGIYANNPTLLAIQRAQNLYPNAKEYIVFSFGTGEVEKKTLSNLGEGGLLQWGTNIADVLMNNAAEYTKNLINSEVRKDPRIKYVRLQPQIQDSEKEMDNVTPANIETLLDVVEKNIEKEKEVLDWIIEEFYKDFGKN